MASLVNSQTGEVMNIGVGGKLYNWRYGPLTIVKTEGKYIEAEIDDQNGIVEITGDSWNTYVHEKTKMFRLKGLGEWLFAIPDDVGLTPVSISEVEFELKLHKFFDASRVLNNRLIDPATKAKKEAERKETERKEKIKQQKEALGKEKEKLESDFAQKEDKLVIMTHR
jgi:hypothetical protein